MSDNVTYLPAANSAAQRDKKNWLFGSLLLIVIVGGWWYPYLGLMVPAVMATGLIVGLFRGRYSCGNICPRGSFLDSWLSLISGNRSVPAWMKGTRFRALVVVGLMGFLGWRLSLDIGNLEHWAEVFWQMCFLTTLVAVTMGIAYRERGWCTVCPMGSFQALESRGRYALQVSSGCRACKLCDSVCPMELPVSEYRGEESVKHPDCLKCSRCVASCPSAALFWPKSA